MLQLRGAAAAWVNMPPGVAYMRAHDHAACWCCCSVCMQAWATACFKNMLLFLLRASPCCLLVLHACRLLVLILLYVHAGA
jgi:hypothetical protein